jgi:hypothetical protein
MAAAYVLVVGGAAGLVAVAERRLSGVLAILVRSHFDARSADCVPKSQLTNTPDAL